MDPWEPARDLNIKYIYINSSDSNCFLRQFCGPVRPFEMTIMDNTQKEVRVVVSVVYIRARASSFEMVGGGGGEGLNKIAIRTGIHYKNMCMPI